MNITLLDKRLILFFRKISTPIARIGLFVVFFWFGFLKVVGQSPASELVHHLFNQTMPYIDFNIFFILFGLFEMIIGGMFLIKGFERLVIPLLFIHLLTTMGPLIMLPQEIWLSFMAPTLEGQYIIKNIALIACAVGIAAQLHPLKDSKFIN